MRVENASNPACKGVEAQIEVTLTGFVDESESLIAQQFHYDEPQRILIIGNDEQSDLVIARVIAILSPAAHTPLGLLTFPDDVPEECDVLLNERIFTVTSGETEAGGILALAVSGYGRDVSTRGTISKKPLEASDFAFDNQEAFWNCSEICRNATEENTQDREMGTASSEQTGLAAPIPIILGEDLSRALVGEVLPTILFPIYNPDESPQMSFSSALIGDRRFVVTSFDVTCLDNTDAGIKFSNSSEVRPHTVSVLCTKPPDEERPSQERGPRSFELYNAETGVQLDLILKGQLGPLVDGREALTNCRGFRLQDLPVGANPGISFRYEITNASFLGEYVGIAVPPGDSPEEGVLGGDLCVGARVRGRHSCADREAGEHSFSISIQVLRSKDDDMESNCRDRIIAHFNETDGLPENEEVIWDEYCEIRYECFEACPEVALNASPTAQPSSYRMMDASEGFCIKLVNGTTNAEESFEARFSCEGEGTDNVAAGLRLGIRYDVEELDGRVVPFDRSTGKPLEPAGFANVDFKGTVRQLSPEECAGTLMFVEGTLVGALSFDTVGSETLEDPLEERYLPVIQRSRIRLVPELYITSSASLGTMDYTIISTPTDRKECFDVTDRLTYKKEATIDVQQPDGTVKEETIVFLAPQLDVRDSEEDSNTTEAFAEFRVYDEKDVRSGGFITEMAGLLRQVCGIEERGSTAVQIQCLAHKPFRLFANETDIELGESELNSIARVQRNGSDPDDLTLQTLANFTISCSCNDVERIKKETNGGDGFIVRAIPLFVDIGANVDGDKVQQLCPVLTVCDPPSPGHCDENDQETSSRP
uniref:Uncharacterized protein n=1 Tax=Vitrella brassicaformis TaxID=1169539 RepID=A0A7S1NY39_9ALVE